MPVSEGSSAQALPVEEPWDAALHAVASHMLGPRNLEHSARELARLHGRPGPPADFPIRRLLRDLRQAFEVSHRAIASAHANDTAITPAAYWVLDNLHVISDSLNALGDLLSPELLETLPALRGPLHERTGGPLLRVHGIVATYVIDLDNSVQADSLQSFVRAYQTVAPLTMAELWALPAFLRLAVLENLLRVAEGTALALQARLLADEHADRALSGLVASGTPPPARERLALSVPDPSVKLPFVVQLIERLRSRGEELIELLDEIAELVRADGLSLEECVHCEQQRQGAHNVSAANAITSLREIGAIEWRSVFEALSVVEEVLASAPGYVKADQTTRDRYRRAIADMARRSGHGEAWIAERAHAAASATEPESPRHQDIGWHLLAAGREKLEAQVGYRVAPAERVRRALRRRPMLFYVGGIGLVAALALFAAAGPGLGPSPNWAAATLLLLFGAFPATDLAVRLVNLLLTRMLPAQPLPRLALGAGIPPQAKTLLAMPVMLTSGPEIAAHLRQLEVHHLANPDSELRYALLSDWCDGPAEHLPDDRPLLDQARELLAALNARYGAVGDEPRFYLFHRRRQWCEGERCWMGWERKRGKLAELNRMLLGARDTSFLPDGGGGLEVPADVRYVLTLDADTRLPIGAVRRLLSAALHPLNRPEFSAAERRVVAGYGVYQPRVTPLLPEHDGGSIFQWAVSGASGMDPYAGAISDVYQDLFGEGIFTGKGLYDLHAFTQALANRLPENAVLSHDLLEGHFARCALVSDVEVYEEFPSHSEVAAARTHRWTRGDWQLLPWLFGRRSSEVLALGRWQLLDNLRRSITAPASLITLLAAWCLPGAIHLPWVGLVLAPLFVPGLVAIVADLMTASNLQWRTRLRVALADVRAELGRGFVALALLGQNAWLRADAIVRALTRLVTRRRLLEWVSAAHVKARTSHTLPMFAWPLRSSSVIVIAATALILWLNPPAIATAAPWLLLLWLAPVIAWVLSAPRVTSHGGVPPTAAEALLFRRVARRTWQFFATFVTAEENHLPPDNFQDDPAPVVAHRTSPTNIGLYLLATLSARDFGWLGLIDSVERLQATFATLARLGRYRGHFYNWYDTQSLQPLEPRYVSVVDSGNLAGHLLTLKQACLELLRGPVIDASRSAAVGDVLGLFVDSLAVGAEEARSTVVSSHELRERAQRMLAAADLLPSAPPGGARAGLAGLHEQALELADLAVALATDRKEGAADYVTWARALVADCASRLRDYELLPAVDAQRLAQLAAESSLLDRLERFPERCASLAEGHAGDPGLATALRTAGARAGDVVAALRQLAAAAEEIAAAMEFGFLFDNRRGLFSIGYRVNDATLDTSYYDLLASEARLASLLAIARGQAPVRHWFRMGRPLIGLAPAPILLSWSGSMFEYLMPCLVMRGPAGCLLEVACDQAVQEQIAYGGRLGMPWGISESAYNLRDQALTYQYADFGVPALGLKRGLGRNCVVAPYATALAVPRDPRCAARNFGALQSLGALGAYGYFDAVDFTSDRVPDDARCVVVRTFMAHHQAMSLVALGNALNQTGMPERFYREPLVQAGMLLLQERAPKLFRPTSRAAELHELRSMPVIGAASGRRVTHAFTARPIAQLLANNRYAVMVTTGGAGYSVCAGRAVTRWRSDAVCERHGTFFYLRDAESGRLWSAGTEPTGVAPDRYEASLDEDRVRIQRVDGSLATTLEIVVSPEDDAELRRITLTNSGTRRRVIDVTSYAEVVLNQQGADLAHPAFSNLFVQTEWNAPNCALLASRRPRSASEPPVWAAHLLATGAGATGTLQYETDRLRFLGRNGDVRTPLSVVDGRPLSNTVGAVLDPVFSLRTRLVIGPGEKVSVTFATLVAATREQALATADKLNNSGAFQRTSMMAWTYARAGLHFLNVTEAESRVVQALVPHLLFALAPLRAPERVLRRNRLPASRLWRFGISGDRPIILVHCRDEEHGDFAAQLVRARTYLEAKQLAVDLVFLNECPHSYLQGLQHRLEELTRLSRRLSPAHATGESGSAFVLRADQLTAEDTTLLLSAARVVLHPREGSLVEQVTRLTAPGEAPPPVPAQALHDDAQAPVGEEDLEFFNGIGGFGSDGREYVVRLESGRPVPAPWSNVIANPGFGCLVTEAGLACTWSGNSRENQLTPWSNDPVTDPPAEVIYIRDEKSGDVWTPTPQPIRVAGVSYVARHGHGYSRWEVAAFGIASELTVFVAREDPVKICRLRLTNASARARRLAVASYVEWSLGASRSVGLPYVTTERHASGALFARNPWNNDFGERVAFVDMRGEQTSATGSRSEFLGRYGSLATPAGLLRQDTLSNRVGAGVEACGALQTEVELPPGASVTVVALLGQATDEAAAALLVERYRTTEIDAALAQCIEQWRAILGAIQVRTPERALDHLMNGWLLYQVLSCRFWGRLGFYQAGGAYGFRDQLQDSLALLPVRPDLVREHLLRAAAHQFEAGDVQHWWHPPSGRGVRTRFVDDRVWLPYVTLRYLAATGDERVLDAEVPFLVGRPIESGHEDAHFEPETTTRRAALYEHCALALEASLGAGPHGLPLMGGGDWNDGMNRVGWEGQGESVWMTWFLASVLPDFAALAEQRGERERATRWREACRGFVAATEAQAWDGAWYRRGYFDDGTPLGSATRPECRIDSIAQSWGVLSGAAQRERAERAMTSVGEHLVRFEDELILLFTPPFDSSLPDPGYVRGYLPGLRENGGQYTHAAIWALMACARLRRLEDVGRYLDMLNPVRRSATRRKAHVYRVEPYVVAADISSEPPNAQRGGWTWYTGSAAWLHRVVLEDILGLHLQGAKLQISQPALPPAWDVVEVRLAMEAYRYVIRIEARSPGCRLQIWHDGVPVSGDVIPLVAGSTSHEIRIVTAG